MAGGGVEVISSLGSGTRVRATFVHGHIDRKPLGDIGSTLVSLLLADPELDLVYEHRRDDQEFRLDTSDLRRELAPVALNRPKSFSGFGGKFRTVCARLGPWRHRSRRCARAAPNGSGEKVRRAMS